MSLKKLRGRSLGEDQERTEQAIASLLERAGLRDAGEYADADLARRVHGNVSSAINPVVQGPFFASFQDRQRTLAALRSTDAAFDSKLCARADRVVEGRFDLL